MTWRELCIFSNIELVLSSFLCKIFIRQLVKLNLTEEDKAGLIEAIRLLIEKGVWKIGNHKS
jgi:hypothetical protein